VSAIPFFLDDLPDLWSQTPCRDRPDLFVDNRSLPPKENVAAAKLLCSQCPVRQDCADYAIANNYRDGIWGGLTLAERDQLARYRATVSGLIE
jgi:hypothetical protein